MGSLRNLHVALDMALEKEMAVKNLELSKTDHKSERKKASFLQKNGVQKNSRLTTRQQRWPWKRQLFYSKDHILLAEVIFCTYLLFFSSSILIMDFLLLRSTLISRPKFCLAFVGGQKKAYYTFPANISFFCG